MALRDDLNNAASSIRKAGQDAQMRLQNLQQLSDATRRENEQIQQLLNQAQSDIQNFETMAREFERQAQLADEMQRQIK
jgi:hypothetical protein